MTAPPLDRAALLADFRTYGRPRHDWLVGGEFERALVRPDGRPVGYGEPDGIEWLLHQLVERRGWSPEEEDGHLIALWKNGGSITLEPGGQVELSGAPHRSLRALADELLENRRELLELVDGRPLRWIACGLSPITAIEDIPWVPKGRYQIMREYLPHFGDLAHFMMKGTCSVQINLDYSDESDCARKVRAAAGLAPLTTALFANSPLYRNQPTGFKSYRSHIWTRTDPARTGFPRSLREGYSHEGWVDYLLDAPMMFYKYGGRWQPAEGRPFRDYLARGHQGHFPDAAEWALHQTSVFPEVRVKRTIEVRGADCVDHRLALAFCAMFAGLLYDEAALDGALELVGGLEAAGSPEERLDRAARQALDAEVGGRRLADWARALMPLAVAGLGRVEPEALGMLDPLLERVEAGRCPADDLLDAWMTNPDPTAVVDAVRY